MVRKLSEIAYDITKNWKKPYFGAVPYLNALRTLDTIKDNFGMDSAQQIVAGFLANATSWRGEEARRLKKELKDILEADMNVEKVNNKLKRSN